MLEYVYVHDVVIRRAPVGSSIPDDLNYSEPLRIDDANEPIAFESNDLRRPYVRASGWVPIMCFKAANELSKKLRCVEGCLNKLYAFKPGGKGRQELGAIGKLRKAPTNRHWGWRAMPPYKRLPLYRLTRTTKSGKKLKRIRFRLLDFDLFGWFGLRTGGDGETHGRLHDFYASSSDCGRDWVSPQGYVHLCHNVGEQGGIALDTYRVATKTKFRTHEVNGKTVFARMAIPRPSDDLIANPFPVMDWRTRELLKPLTDAHRATKYLAFARWFQTGVKKAMVGTGTQAQRDTIAELDAAILKTDADLKSAKKVAIAGGRARLKPVTIWKRAERYELYVYGRFEFDVHPPSALGWIPVRALEEKACNRLLMKERAQRRKS